MNKIVIVFFALILNVGYSQVVDTLYYTENWELSNQQFYEYYRVSEIDTSNLRFVGTFKDYYKNNSVLLEGSYDNDGIRQGLFIRYFSTGTIYSRGNYEDNWQSGKWAYYYENGSMTEVVDFSGRHFVITEYIDPDGNVLVKNGTGTWKRSFLNTNGSHNYLYAEFLNGQRGGTWKYKLNDQKIFLKEVYEEGELKKGKRFVQYGTQTSTERYNETAFGIDIFYPRSFEIIENFKTSSVAYKEDYPYMDLPPRPQSKNSNNTVTDEVFTPIDESAHYPGGMQAFYKSVMKTMRYPKEARRLGIQGEVFVEFVINKSGRLQDVKVVKGIGGGCDEEAVRAIIEAGDWLPAKQKEKAVMQKIILPITFQLG